jgi:predicted Zn finger-like uncharacterized protein
MKAQCPECKAVYNIDDSKIPEKGAQATCAKCKTQFSIKRGETTEEPDKVEESHLIISCPNCGHVNLSPDKCSKCGTVFSDEDKKKLGIQI